MDAAGGLAPGGGPDPEALPSVSVVMPTYRRADRLSAAVEPLLADPATTEVIVVADGGGDDTERVVSRLAAADARVRLLSPPHGGQRHAVASGVEAARGEVVLLLDDDVVALPHLVSGHARRHLGRAGLVVVGYMPCAEPDGTGGVPLLTRIYGAEYEAHCTAVERDPALVLRDLWGGNVSLRTEDCRRVGFTPWPFAHDDRDFGLRCARAGLEGVFDRALRAEHRHQRSGRQFLAGARSFGAGRALLHLVHGDLLGPFDEERELGHVPAALRPVVRFLAVPGRVGAVTAPLLGVARLARVFRLEALESTAYRLARRFELRVGAGEVLAAAAAGRMGDGAPRSA